MGTSQSSSGSPSSVPMVPPWVPDPESPDEDEAGEHDNEQQDEQDRDLLSPQLLPLAPPARFSGARRSLGSFAQSGDLHSMRRGLGQYVRRGYGGAKSATKRFGGTVKTARDLYNALSASASGQVTSGSPLDPVLLMGRAAREVMDAIVEAVRPIDGTQDSEANRKAICDALSGLLQRFPEADLLHLSEEERFFAIERFVACDVYRRFELDVGKTVQNRAETISTGLARLKEVREYIRETIAAAFRKLNQVGQRVTSGRIGQVVRAALRETFEVFEDYIR